MASWVLLRHDLPAGSWHLDWLLEPIGRSVAHPDDRVLISFRIARIGADWSPLIGGGQVRAARMPDHRAAYLTFEGPLSGDRGRVTRLARGRVLELRVSDERFECVIGSEGAGGAMSAWAGVPAPDARGGVGAEWTLRANP